MSKVVLDASAVLAVLQDEPGADRVLALEERPCVSAVNYAEVATKLLDAGFPSAAIQHRIKQIAPEVITFDEVLAAATAALRPLTRAHGLSLGDRACLALAQSLQLPALTTDKAWAKLKIGVKIEVIR